METITQTYNVYTFDELSKESQQKAIEKNYDFNVSESWWSECVIDDRTAKLIEHGFNDAKILYSGFGSQGDGACFTATLDNDGLLQFLTKTKELAKYPALVRAIKKETIYCNIKITHSFNYLHAYSTTLGEFITNNTMPPPKLQKEYEQWYESFDGKCERGGSIGWYYDECNDIYRHLEREYDYQTSDEAIGGSLIANEMTFLENGGEFITNNTI
jgi:hypothetical protein